MSEPITLESLQRYDQGIVANLFKKAIRAIYLDLDERPRLTTARKLKFEMRFKPTADTETGDLIEIAIEYDVDPVLPKKKGRVNVCLPHSELGICFDGDSTRTRTKPGQQTIDFGDETDVS